MDKKTSKAANISLLANRVYFATKLIAACDVCNDFDAAGQPQSAEFKSYRANLDKLVSDMKKVDESDEALEAGIKAEGILNGLNALDDNGRLKPQEELFESFRLRLERQKNEKLAECLAFYRQNDSKEGEKLRKDFEEFLKKNQIKNIESGSLNSSDKGKIKKIRENLADDFALLQKVQPDHLFNKILSDDVKKQTSGLGYSVYYVQEDPVKNDELGKDFNSNPESKQKFLKLMGYLFDLGEKLKNNPSAVNSSHYNMIKEFSGNHDFSADTINKIAEKCYSSLETGLWAYKNKVNYDRFTKKSDYMKTNVSLWIKDLKLGKNNIGRLALLSPSEEREYQNASELRKEEIAKKHISIHHKLPKKYHNLVPGNEFDFNHISNFMMIIDGNLHNQRHKKDLKNKILLGANHDNSIFAAPNEDMSRELNVAMSIKEPESIAQKRNPNVGGKKEINVMSLILGRSQNVA